jgi:hypothetical protein
MTLATQQRSAQFRMGHFPVRDREFLKPTLAGIGVAVGVLITLTLFLVALAGLVSDGESIREAEGNTERGEDVVALDSGPLEITDSATAPIESSPAQATSTRERTKPLRKEALAPFVIASLPSPTSGHGTDSQGGGQGFGDVEQRLGQAGARSGDVQISLAWNNVNDLDLHVVTPDGETISFNSKRSSCGGELDVDMNAGGRSSNKPVENVFWPTGQAPKGEFIVAVHHYGNRGGADPTRYQVIVKVDGKTRKFSGAVTSGDRPETVHRFTRR